MQKVFWQIFCIFEPPLWIYELLWNIEFCFFLYHRKRKDTNFLGLVLPDVPIKCPKQFLYINSRVRAYAKISSLNFLCFVGFQASEIWMLFGKFTAELVWKSFSGRNNSLESPFFDFVTVYHMAWKNEERCGSWLLEFWVSRRLKMQKNICQQFFCACFWAAIMNLLITLKHQFVLFLIPCLEEFRPVKYYFSRIRTSRNIKL